MFKAYLQFGEQCCGELLDESVEKCCAATSPKTLHLPQIDRTQQRHREWHRHGQTSRPCKRFVALRRFRSAATHYLHQILRHKIIHILQHRERDEKVVSLLHLPMKSIELWSGKCCTCHIKTYITTPISLHLRAKTHIQSKVKCTKCYTCRTKQFHNITLWNLRNDRFFCRYKIPPNRNHPPPPPKRRLHRAILPPIAPFVQGFAKAVHQKHLDPTLPGHGEPEGGSCRWIAVFFQMGEEETFVVCNLKNLQNLENGRSSDVLGL